MRIARRSPTIWFAAAILAFSGLASGCGKQSPNSAGSVDTAGLATTPDESSIPVTDKDCQAFAETLANAVAGGDMQTINDRIDWLAIAHRGGQGLNLSEKGRKGIQQKLKEWLARPGSFLHQLVTNVKQGGTYDLLRIKTDEKQKCVVFRLVQPNDGGFNYHEWRLVRRTSGVVVADDCYIHLAGEFLSQTIRRIMIPLAAEPALATNIDVIRAVGLDMQAQRFADALAKLDGLPAELKQEKAIMLVRVQAAQGINDKIHLRALEAFRTKFPNDACVDFVSLDYYALKEDWAKAVACAQRVNDSVGGDPFLLEIIAGIHLKANNPAAARTAAQQSLAGDPKRELPHWRLLEVAVHERQYDEAARIVATLRKQFDIAADEFAKLPEYAEFVKTPQFKKFLAEQPNAPAKQAAKAK